MKKVFLALFILVTFLGVASAQQQDTALPVAPDTQLSNLWHTFTGKWMPSIDASLIGAENYKTLQNLRYTDGGLEGVQGYSKINSSIVNATYFKIRNGHQLKKDEPAETHVLVQAYRSSLSGSKVYENSTAIGSTGNFTATELHTDESGAGIGRFSSGAQGTVLYCNGVSSMIYGGDESLVAAFLTSTAAIDDELTNPKDYSKEVQNKLQTPGEVAVIGGGNDSDTLLLIPSDGADESVSFTDSSVNGHVITEHGTAQLDSSYRYFGSASGLYDGNSDWISASDNDGVDDWWHMDTSKFTIDFWVRFNSVAADCGLVQQHDGANNSVRLFWKDGTHQLEFYIQDGGSYTLTLTAGWVPVVNTWYHIAVIRGWGGNANDWALCVDGTAIDTEVGDASPWPDLTSNLNVGRSNDLTDTIKYHNGWIDEFRFSTAARWTTTYTLPTRAYCDDAMYAVVGATRPLQGFKPYILTGTTGSPTLSVDEWNGFAWVSVSNLTDSTSGFASTGTVTWDSTVSTSKPKYLEGLYLYFYRLTLTSSDADIYYVTIDAPFQDLVDIWDGVFRQPIQFQVKRNTKWEDYSLEVNTETEMSDYPFTATIGGIDENDQMIVMFDDRITAIRFNMFDKKTNDLASLIRIYYWDGTDYVKLLNLVDLTLDSGETKSFNRTGVVSWSPPGEEVEFAKEKFGIYGYSYKILVTSALEDGVSDHKKVSIDTITGIPAQLKIRPFKFPAEYNNRTMLCGFTESGQGNRIDFSLPNTPNVFNGEESSNGGISSLYVGGDTELSCVAKIENRYGSSLISGFAIFKDTETYLLLGNTPDMEDIDRFRILPISHNVGCPAPLTLVNIEMGYAVAEDAQRQAVIGLSYAGPFLFDGSVILPLKGVENYFDPAEAECINFSSIDVSRGAYDQTKKEYNLLIPSGTSQSTNNIWLIYDLVRKKWFQKVPATYPGALLSVTDIHGARYIYGGLDTGYMMHIEDGNTWDGTGIAQVVETGDFFPADNSPWYKTRVRRIKLAALKVTENVDVAITHYADTATSGTSLTALVLDSGANRITRATQATNILAWAHRLKFSATTSSTAKGMRPIGWGAQYRIEREDLSGIEPSYKSLLAENGDNLMCENADQIIVLIEQ